VKRTGQSPARSCQRPRPSRRLSGSRPARKGCFDDVAARRAEPSAFEVSTRAKIVVVRQPTPADVESRLRASYALDHLWGETMGLPVGDSKEAPLRLVTGLLETERVPYALIGGVAMQLHSQEPRSTRDIVLAVRTYADVPSEALISAGFEHTGRRAHGDHWLAPGPGLREERTALQFSAEDNALVGTVERACVIEVDGMRLRLVTALDLIVLKLAAAEDPKRRPGERRRDLADILTLIEEHPDIDSAIPGLAERLQRIRVDVSNLDLDR
jgi:hypothetical protein